MAQNEGRTLRRAPRSARYFATVFVVIVVSSTLFGLAVHSLKSFAESVVVAAAAEATPDTNNGTTTPSPTLNSQQGSLLVERTTPSCENSVYELPKPLDLTGYPAGVTVVEDSPQRYSIYGATTEQHREQLQTCTPIGQYAAAASYQISWQYNYVLQAGGLCKVVSPKIGLHLNMVLPEWEPTAATTDQTRQTWDDFIGNLTHHERGHYDISREYAKNMLQTLQQLPARSCDNLTGYIDTVLAEKLDELRAAQERYDATTDHGATQGAVLI